MKELKDLTEEEFNKLKEVGMLWELFPEAPENFNDMLQGQLIYKKVKKLEEQIKDCNSKILAEQSTCKHPRRFLDIENGANTGNYDPSSDSYWTNVTCKVCGKRWIIDGSWSREDVELS